MIIESIRNTNIKGVNNVSNIRQVKKEAKPVTKNTYKDSVVISLESRKMMGDTDRIKKIEELKRKVDLGEYTVNTYELSKKILYSMRGE